LLVDHPGKRLPVIHDRKGQHKGAPVEAIACAADERLALKAQPIYSPALNFRECIWKWLRWASTHNHWFATLQEPSAAIRNFSRYLAGVEDQVRHLCSFKTPHSSVASLQCRHA
jgi:hypothetical protein